MLIQKPFAAVTAALDGDVLDVMVRADGHAMSTAEVARATGKSYAGVRSAVLRLAAQGTLTSARAGNQTLFAFNTEHILAPALREIVGARTRVWDRIRDIVAATFATTPRYAAVFGSAATGSMTEQSDIDIYFERPKGADEPRFDVDADSVAWQVFRLTGNDVRPLIYGEEEVDGKMGRQLVLAEIARDGITVAGDATRFRARVRRGARNATS